MSRPKPTLVPPCKPVTKAKPGPSYALLRKACRLFKGSMGPRSQRHKNIRQWIAKTMELGDKHVYRGGEVKWGNQFKGIHK